MKQGRTLIGLAEELERQLSTKVDMIVPTPLMHHVTDTGGATALLIEAPGEWAGVLEAKGFTPSYVTMMKPLKAPSNAVTA